MAHFPTLITLGVAKWTLWGPVVALPTPKTTIAVRLPLMTHYVDFLTSSCTRHTGLACPKRRTLRSRLSSDLLHVSGSRFHTLR